MNPNVNVGSLMPQRHALRPIKTSQSQHVFDLDVCVCVNMQSWNHAFYWDCMKPGGGGKPSGTLAAQIDKVSQTSDI
jgi:superoxide dismutase